MQATVVGTRRLIHNDRHRVSTPATGQTGRKPLTGSICEGTGPRNGRSAKSLNPLRWRPDFCSLPQFLFRTEPIRLRRSDRAAPFFPKFMSTSGNCGFVYLVGGFKMGARHRSGSQAARRPSGIRFRREWYWCHPRDHHSGAGAGCREYAADNVSGHEHGRQCPEVRIAPTIDAPTCAAERDAAGECAVPAVLKGHPLAGSRSAMQNRLETYPTMPTARQRSSSPFIAFAVQARMDVCLFPVCSNRRICHVIARTLTRP